MQCTFRAASKTEHEARLLEGLPCAVRSSRQEVTEFSQEFQNLKGNSYTWLSFRLIPFRFISSYLELRSLSWRADWKDECVCSPVYIVHRACSESPYGCQVTSPRKVLGPCVSSFTGFLWTKACRCHLSASWAKQTDEGLKIFFQLITLNRSSRICGVSENVQLCRGVRVWTG